MIRRLVVSAVLPMAILVGLPVLAIFRRDSDEVAWLGQLPQPAVASSLGAVLMIMGLALMAATIPMFLRQNEGTIMPWDPAPKLIVEGVYRHVRNPMHSGVFAVLLGEALLLRSALILSFAVFAIILHLFYIPYSEERGLERRFGEQYRIYKQNVPRWIPRLTPWVADPHLEDSS
jgi:protein-S-isoprenylcysteine O-methyltransferase Ste14